MYTAYFDSGTSNSRIYLLDRHLKVAATGKKAVGSKDSALSGTNEVLIRALKGLYDSALQDAGITDSQVGRIFASGMVTSPYGLQEIPHLPAPLPLARLVDHTASHCEKLCFSRELHLIPGVRTGDPATALDEDSVVHVNSMRGEEIELLGIHAVLSDRMGADGYIVVNPGSHTHISLLRNGSLEDIFSTFSGELYHAIVSGTILGAAVSQDAPPDCDAAWKGYLALEQYGVNRALYLCHTQKIFEVNDSARRKSFLEGVLCGGLVTGLRNLCRARWKDARYIVVAQQGGSSGILSYLLERAIPEREVFELAPGNQSFALNGICEFLRLLAEKEAGNGA